MSKKKYFFENEDSENCYTGAYFQHKMKEEEITELTVLEAIKSKEKQYIYCTEVDTCGEASECGKQCEAYEPRNGKNGCCKHRRAIYEHGKEVTLKLKLNN
jgi:tagatose-1,6-bisphosphate aldolase non-catalytic subunit AgaZ/GatZ